MNVLLIVQDAPYGTEKAYNAFRLAMALQREQPGVEVAVFLLGDAVSCALPNQVTPQGYYNLERMLKAVLAKGGQVKLCGSCAEARGLKELDLIEGAEVSTMGQLAAWVVQSERVLTF